ncbi:hypothetical protein HYPSUDRAFT_63891 [Hypholoma sublateritium FD-334 SS-4]|uniref:WSC domain-containing protein n=1 Tax=Hypholoma sublateritium (strain FD-334 SS-4) TaxID=945553 RepID=A0A0D2MRT3_HYPSF|nr:hypothetical protein HYPSUDRAFT_63891 [Hypholoma sublateritium FD-334 SS-4]
MDGTSMTIESCVAFCNQQGQRLAGLLGPQCVCSNIFRPGGNCFESDPGQCTIPGLSTACPGNPVESCGGLNTMPPVYNLLRNEDSQFFCSDPTWPGGAALVVGQWRFSYFYNDSITARALGRNAVNLPVPVPRGNMTSAICTTACGNAGFTLAGVEFADECYCGNAIENNAAPISALQHCDGIPTTFIPFPTTGSALMACTGNVQEFCGGPDIISIYTLPGTGIIPLIPFDEDLGGQCTANNCVGST